MERGRLNSMEHTDNLYACSCKEVITILGCLSIEDIAKIPMEKLEFFFDNMSESYEYKLDENRCFRDQKMLPMTEAILANLFRDYLATPEQREEIIKKEENDLKELPKEEIDECVENQSSDDINICLIETQQPLFKRILNKIKTWFKKNNNKKIKNF